MTKKSEAEICALFADQARQQGWTVHPEVAGWDLLLVWEGEPRDSNDELPEWLESRRRTSPTWRLHPGDQIAIEAKARSCPEAFEQAISRQDRYNRSAKRGPDFIGLLAPTWSRGYQSIASRCRFRLFDAGHYEGVIKTRFDNRKPEEYTDFKSIRAGERLRLNFETKLWVPPVVAESVVAGAPSPSGLTAWRVKALKLCSKLRETGEVTSRDFKELGLSMTRWRAGNSKQKWLVDTGRKRGRLTIYAINDPVPPDFPDIGWEAERDAIAELKETEVLP